MMQDEFNRGLLQFIQSSPTPFHAVDNMSAELEKHGFVQVREADSWALEPGGRYFVIRNGSSIIAFVVGQQTPVENGFRLVGAHTDSPCLKVKPCPEILKKGSFQLGVEVYGGALLNPWFDRDLSLAGRVVYRDNNGKIKATLVNFKRPVAVVPSLAIHLDREANRKRAINSQNDIPPILFQCEEGRTSCFGDILLAELEASGIKDVDTITDHELCFYDTQPPALVGLHNDFIAGARLDNLLSCYTGLQSMLAAGDNVSCMLICTDHEEVGSVSACGAAGPLLASVLERIIPDSEHRNRALSQSLLISADNAHGVHPNYSDKHDQNHQPILNRGPAIKVNANQRYATSSLTAAQFRQWCEQASVAVQSFVARTDMGCGSTIGPITASAVGVSTLDVGVPTYAMHSIRELAGSKDAHDLYRVFRAFYQHSEPLDMDGE